MFTAEGDGCPQRLFTLLRQAGGNGPQLLIHMERSPRKKYYNYTSTSLRGYVVLVTQLARKRMNHSASALSFLAIYFLRQFDIPPLYIYIYRVF